MIKSIKSIIFACVFGLGISSAFSATSHSVLLASGSDVEFVNFMNKNAKKIVKTNEWSNLVEVLAVYNSNPSQLSQLSAEKREAFSVAANMITKRLSKMKSNEAAVWSSKLATTSKVVKFLWKQNLSATPTLDTEEETLITLGK